MEEQENNVASTEEKEEVGSTQEEGKSEENKNPSNLPNEGSNEANPPATDDAVKKAEEQSKADDAKFAKERHERDMAKAKAAGDAEGYKRARLKSIGKKNPYTETPIETDEDYEFYELLDEVNSRGLDPKNPMDVEKVRRELVAEKNEEIEKNKSEAQKNQEKADNEVKEYLAEGHTQAELKEHWDNPKFMEFAEDLLGVVPLKTIIAKFDKAYPKEKQEVKKQAANKQSSPGSASNDEQEVPQKKISEMSKEEFAKYMDDVAKGKTSIK